MFIKDILSVSIDNSTEENKCAYKGYDFSMLNSISTCPFYGIVRYEYNKVFQVTDRNMALECGALCHECYAAYRALSIFYSRKGENSSKAMDLSFRELKKIFSEVTGETDNDKLNEILHKLVQEANDKVTPLAKYTVFSDWIIDNSGYYDDPEDKKRTIANIKESMLAYCSNFLDIVQREPVWVNEDYTKCGIEIPFDALITITYKNNDQVLDKKIRFIGKVDGIHVREDGSLIIHENKTASRLDDSWVGQWYKSHQITGYCLFASYFTNEQCLQARVLGMQIPVPKYSGYSFRTERVDRESQYFEDWARWLLSTIDIVDNYKDCPEIAPMNTHACCKYYKQCAFLPLCVLDKNERLRVMNEEMVEQVWSPLDE